MDAILLHHCCAPCSYAVIDVLAPRFAITGFWYNPNIHPDEECQLRRTALFSLAETRGISVLSGPVMSIDQWQAQAPAAVPDRCRYCYELRLNETAAQAAQRGFQRFTSSLLISPYQKHELVKEVGIAAGQRHGVAFHYEDFRSHFFTSKNAARAAGLYMQKYCGCASSKEERDAEKRARNDAKKR